MKILNIIFALSMLAGVEVHGAPVKRLFQDVKLPTQKVLEVQSWTNPTANASTDIFNNIQGPTSAAADVISSGFMAQPDYPRNLVLANSDNTASEQLACIVTVSGTNINNHSISETFTFSNGVISVLTGAKAFKTVTSVSFPASCVGGAFNVHYYLGFGKVFGLKRCMANNGDVFKELLNGANATVGTALSSSTAVESNTIQFNSNPSGSNSFTEYFVQNYLCF